MMENQTKYCVSGNSSLLRRVARATLLTAFAVAPTVSIASLWNDEDFVARFTATYGVRGDLEPKVTREEQALLRRVAEQMPQNPREAVAVLAAGLKPESAAGLDFTLGNLRFQLDEFDEAERHYREAIRKFPDFLRAHKNLGLVLARQDRFAEAATALSRALTLGSADSDTYGLIGFAHLQQGLAVSAEAAYRQALLFEPENANWQVGLAQALQNQDRHAEAAALLAELTSRYPERADFWLYQANTYIAIRDSARAAANLELVRRMGRIGRDGLLLLGDIYVNEDLPRLALSAYEEAFLDGGPIPFARTLRGAERLAQRGHAVEAAQLVSRIEPHPGAAVSPREEGQLNRLKARLALAEGDSSAARSLLQEALEASPMDGESLLLLALVVGADDFEHAELLLTRAARLPESAPQAFRQHGELLVRAGRYAEALAPLRHAQVLQPGEALRRYIERLERLAETAREE